MKRYRGGLLDDFDLGDVCSQKDIPQDRFSIFKELVEQAIQNSPEVAEFIVDKAIEILSDPRAKKLRGKLNKNLRYKSTSDPDLRRGRSIKILPQYVQAVLETFMKRGLSRADAIGQIAELHTWERRAINAALRRLKK